MTEDRSPPVKVAALRAEEFSADGSEITICLTTTYSNRERRYSVPIRCFYDFIVDLQRLNAGRELSSTEISIQPATNPQPQDERAETVKV
jgi:hypothetical protein